MTPQTYACGYVRYIIICFFFLFCVVQKVLRFTLIFEILKLKVYYAPIPPHPSNLNIYIFSYPVNRGPATEWYDALYLLLRCSRNVRKWFAQNVLFAHPSRFAEYLLECPSSEVSSFFFIFFILQVFVFCFVCFFPSKFLMRYLKFQKNYIKKYFQLSVQLHSRKSIHM